MKKFAFVVLVLLIGITFAIDWSRTQGNDPENVTRSVIRGLECYEDRTGQIVSVKWGYRSYDEQVEIRDRIFRENQHSGYYQNNRGEVRSSSGALMAAAPGSSQHERGNAVDLFNHNAINVRVMESCGGRRPDVRNEPWHWEF